MVLFNFITILSYLQFQDLVNQDNIQQSTLKDSIKFWFSVHGTVLSIVEITCYLILYHHIYSHNVDIASKLLDASVIKKRNQQNAVSLTGLFAGWLMEVWYIVLVGIFSTIFENNWIYEMSAFFKVYVYYLIPLVQIHTSAPLRKLSFKIKNDWGLN